MERTALPDPQLRFPIHFLEMLESLVRTAGGDVGGCAQPAAWVTKAARKR